MVKKKVFVSYDHSEDLHYKNLLKAWNSNPNFDFSFDQRSPDVAINSINASTIQAALTSMMKQADYLLVIIGEKSHLSSWMNWEISRAKMSDVKLKLAAVKLSYYNTTPSGLLGVSTSFANSFTEEGIISALNNASNYY
ncbi:TIR domain-containing protein [Chitinophaga sp. 30R24]|uniref:TIR domain-containing protein n=1 Tax=Chitinophaga sp. 30R24 TaxID=3248838 RepID=UPI003B90F7F7